MVDGWPPYLAALGEVRNQCGTLFRVVPMMKQEIAAVSEMAQAGRPDGLLLLAALTFGHDWIEYPAPGAFPMPCVGCTRPLAGQPRSYGMVVPDVPEPTIAVALAVCPTCGPDPESIISAVRPCLRIFWPDLRRITIAGPGGRA